MTRTAEQIEQEERDAERLLVAAKCARRKLPRVEVFDRPRQNRQRKTKKIDRGFKRTWKSAREQ